MAKKGYGNVSDKFKHYFQKDARARKAGPHDPKNAKQQAQPKNDFNAWLHGSCPVCLEPLGAQPIVNPIIGKVCSVECLEDYWRGNGKQEE